MYIYTHIYMYIDVSICIYIHKYMYTDMSMFGLLAEAVGLFKIGRELNVTVWDVPSTGTIMNDASTSFFGMVGMLILLG